LEEMAPQKKKEKGGPIGTISPVFCKRGKQKEKGGKAGPALWKKKERKERKERESASSTPF